jgi:N-acyl-D-amino-acid deacylase
MHDLVIENALICDGTGAEPYVASLALKDGRIAAVGLDAGEGRKHIDAKGLALMPGIIDGHTHLDAQLTWDPFASPSPSLGVTTVVIGNCGFTIAPCRPQDRDLTLRNLTQVEGMSLDALRAGVCWEFVSFPEYLTFLERRGVGPNVAAFVGHSSLRTYVMGVDASERAATDDEIAKMAAIVREAMDAGAVGFSSTTAPQHNGEHGKPMPSRLSDVQEMEALTGVLGEVGRGVFMTTRGDATPIASIEALAARNGRPALVSGFLHNPAVPDRHVKLLEQMRAARERGHRLIGEVTCCPLTMDFTLQSAYLLEGFPAWRPAMTVKGDELKALYANPQFRQAVKDDLERYKGTRAFNSEWHKLNIVEVADPAHQALEGMTIAALAEREGKHPLDSLLDFGIKEDLKTLFTAILLNSDPEPVGKLISDPDNYVTLSDAGAHITFFCDAGFGLHLLGHWVREQKTIPLQEAVRKLTGQAAEIFGIGDRGRLAVGLAGDLLLIDPSTVGRGPNVRVRDFPAGAARLTTRALGVHGVWINGVRVVLDSEGSMATDERPGKVLREFAA